MGGCSTCGGGDLLSSRTTVAQPYILISSFQYKKVLFNRKPLLHPIFAFLYPSPESNHCVTSVLLVRSDLVADLQDNIVSYFHYLDLRSAPAPGDHAIPAAVIGLGTVRGRVTK